MSPHLERLPDRWPSWFYKHLTDARTRTGITLEVLIHELGLWGHSGIYLTTLTEAPFPVIGNWHVVVPLIAKIVGTDPAWLFAPLTTEGLVDRDRLGRFYEYECLVTRLVDENDLNTGDPTDDPN